MYVGQREGVAVLMYCTLCWGTEEIQTGAKDCDKASVSVFSLTSSLIVFLVRTVLETEAHLHSKVFSLILHTVIRPLPWNSIQEAVKGVHLNALYNLCDAR